MLQSIWQNKSYPVDQIFKVQYVPPQAIPETASPTPMETSGCEPADPADLCQAFSDVILHTAIRDVDADDFNNPMLCSEYVKDIYKYLRVLEASFFWRSTSHTAVLSLNTNWHYVEGRGLVFSAVGLPGVRLSLF